MRLSKGDRSTAKADFIYAVLLLVSGVLMILAGIAINRLLAGGATVWVRLAALLVCVPLWGSGGFFVLLSLELFFDALVQRASSKPNL